MKRKVSNLKVMILTLGIILMSFTSVASTIHVPGDYATIQEALNAANTGDEVVVAAGTYYENIIWPSTDGITLSGSGEETCFIDGSETASVIRFEFDNNPMITNATLIQGFTIQNGYAQGTGQDEDEGGGIFLIDSSPSFENLIIKNNLAYYGGGVNMHSWTPHYFTPSFNNVKIIGNESESYGGGVRISRCDPTIENCIISDNLSHSSGGGIQAWISSDITLIDVTISNNSAIVEGYSAGHGGGIDCFPGAKLFMTNVVVTNNFATWYGGGLYYSHNASESTFTNVTISNNTSAFGGGVFLIEVTSGLTLTNCIIWDNIPNEVEFDDVNYPSILTVSYSDIKDGQAGIQTNGNGTVTWGTGNINKDPFFCDPTNFVYTLAEDSPCVGTGQNGANMGALEVACGPVGINEGLITNNYTPQIKIYPNPANDHIVINCVEQNVDIQSVVITDISGSIAVSEEKQNNQEKVDISALKSGVYFVIVSTEKGIFNEKLIVY
ncbi:MAG: T9SS type A sorting domain-containing protein [Bacteroidota bacterium]